MVTAAKYITTMDAPNTLISLVINQNSADNNVRVSAELDFKKLAGDNPSQTAQELIQSCAPESPLQIDVKQSCLLHLKRLVPKYWSMGFQLFIGPPIDQSTKAFIRESLLLLATSSPSSKIRTGSAYVIVQIAAADFPDEWPDLLDVLYSCATGNHDSISIMGSLSVLNDLFDDLISESQFWEGGVGNKLISYISYLLEQSQMSAEIKISALRLYLTVLNTLLSPEALELVERKTSVISHIKFLAQLLLSLTENLISITSSGESVELVELSLRSHLYQVFTRILSNFRRYISPSIISSAVHFLVDDLWLSSKIFKKIVIEEAEMPVVKTEDLDETKDFVSTHLISLFEALSAAQDSCSIIETLGAEKSGQFLTALSACSQYPKATIEDYSADFNVFVTDAAGLSSHVSTRDSIQEFLGQLNDTDSARIFELIKSDPTRNSQSWMEREAFLLLNEGLFSNQESKSLENDLSLTPYFADLYSSIQHDNVDSAHPLLIARIFLLIPKVLEKFSSKDSIDTFCVNGFERIFEIVMSSSRRNEHELIMASSLISATLWRNIEAFDLKKLPGKLQVSIMKVCSSLLDESEEDSLPIILEAISFAIGIDNKASFNVEIEQDVSVIDLILRVSFKDPANVQVTIDSVECLESLLNEVAQEDFLHVCQKLMPYFVEIMRSALSQNIVDFSSQLYLTLDLLGYVIEASPFSELPSDIFVYIFPVLKDLILRTSDDQILQAAGEVFNKLMQNNENLFIKYADPETGTSGLAILLEIASKFLSPDLSDSAAMNCGLIVITLFERFQNCLDSDFFFQLLQATVIRLAIAKEVITIENLILVFCKLVLNTSPLTLINALTNMEMKDASENVRDGLQTVLPIWFESFEVTRGVEKIEQNILALGKIFSLGDERVEQVQVDGDLIPYNGDLIITRSMAKTMPQKFTQISAPHKILKLLASELSFQSLQPDPEDYVLEKSDGGDDDDDWEDMDGVGVPNYDKLKSYVDSDEEDMDETSNKGIKDILVQFFKECISKNISNFQNYYEMLDDDEKTAISENVIFT